MRGNPSIVPPVAPLRSRALTVALAALLPAATALAGPGDARAAARAKRIAPEGGASVAGLVLEVREDRLLVAGVEPGSPAAASGVLPGDRILIVNDVSLIDLQPIDARAALELMSGGPAGEIRLLVGRGAGTLGVVLPRRTPAPRPDRGPRAEPPEIGGEAPAFSAGDLRGVEVRLAALRGRPVLIDFWASWCPPCRGTALTVRRLAAEYGDRLAIVGVSLDEDRRAYEAFVYNHHLPGHQIFDGGWDGPVASRYGVAAVGIPYGVLVGEDGRVVARGSSLSVIEAEIARRLGGASARAE